MQKINADIARYVPAMRYGLEHCKVALLLSAILLVPLRDVFVSCVDGYVPYGVARGIGISFWGLVFGFLFFIPFLCRAAFPKDVFLLAIAILLGFLPFALQRTDEWRQLGVTLAKTMIMAFPYYAVARSLKDYDLLERALHGTGVVINIAVLVAMESRVAAQGGYSMGLAYAALPGAIIALRMLFQKRTFFNALNTGIAVFALAFCGTRGPMVCFVLFGCYEMIRVLGTPRKISARKLLAVGSIVVFLLSASVQAYDSLSSLQEYASAHGWSGRIFSRLIAGNFFQDQSRTDIRQAAWEIVQENSLTGVGLLEDRRRIFDWGLRNTEWAEREREKGYQGWYSHFVFLDWLLEYGVVLGGILSLAALLCVYRIFSMPRCALKNCLEIFVFAGCCPLLFSGIWHEERLFYIVLGLSVSMRENRGLNLQASGMVEEGETFVGK